jgi:TP901 family phage tail tape measure protein
MREARQAAQDFSTAVAEAFTISTGALGDMDQVSQSVLDLSRALGEPALEVAEGLYQTLSNQVVEAGDALRFESQAAELAIATHSELRDAVNALSSVMNSYGLDVSEVEHVSDVLFKTIELGRLRLSEFGNVLGRVSPLTAALGIRFEEMAAAIATITQKGVPAHTAITQLTQVSQKLLRPTAKLQELYEEWGVKTGPEAIRRFGGLREVLVKMQDASAGNDKEFADLLGRVRALVGALNLTTDSASALGEAMTEMTDSSKATQKALEEMRSSAGRRATEAFNRLGVTMIELGQHLLALTTPIVEIFDAAIRNANLLKAAAVGTIAGLTGMAFAAAGLAGSFASAAVQAAALRAVLITLLPVLLTTAAAYVALNIADWFKGVDETAGEAVDTMIKQNERLTAQHAKQTQIRIQATRDEMDERRKATSKYLTDASLAYRQDFNVLKAHSDAITKLVNEAFQDAVGKQKKAIADLKKAGLDADDAIKASAQEVANTQKSLSDASYKRDTRRLSDRQKLWADLDRAQDAAAKARTAYANAGANEEAVAAARELSHVAEKRAEEAVAQAERLGNVGLIRRAEEELAKVRQQRVKDETQFQVDRERAQGEAIKSGIKEAEGAITILEGLWDTALEKVQRISEDAPKGPEAMVQSLKEFQALIPEVAEQAERAFDFSFADQIGLDPGLEKLAVGVTTALKSANLDYERLVNEFAAKLQSREIEAGVTLKIENEYIFEEVRRRFGEINPLGNTAENIEEITQVIDDLTIEALEFERAIADSEGNISHTVDTIRKQLEGITPAPIPTIDKEALKNAHRYSTEAERRASFAKESISFEDTLKAAILDGANILEKAKNEQRNITEAEAKRINLISEYGKRLEETGTISKNISGELGTLFKILVGSVEQLQASLKAYRENAKLQPAIEEGKQELERFKQAAIEGQKAQETVKDAAAGTKDEVSASVETQASMPEVTAAATQALAAETAEALRLKAALEGAVTAQSSITSSTATSAAVSAVTTPEVTSSTATSAVAEQKAVTTELQAQTQEAEKFNQVVGTLKNTYAIVNPYVTETSTNTQAAATSASQMSNSVQTLVNPLIEANSQIQQTQAGTTGVNAELLATIKSTETLASVTSGWNAQLQKCVYSAGAAAQAMNLAAQAALQAARACAAATTACGGGRVTASRGGRYFASGGRGTDTIAARLSPGEFIINARSARTFFPQLQAINAGQQPVYREQGGSVTNVGDVNVTVQGGDNSQQTIREIANGLRRELSRGTIKL